VPKPWWLCSDSYLMCCVRKLTIQLNHRLGCSVTEHWTGKINWCLRGKLLKWG
ncbi:hypothetical protein Droror1_Dr00025717, partial [Drosera rotundifolia]